MTGISSSVPPLKFDSNGNILANINAQNIYPITYGSDLIVGSSLTLTNNAGFNAIYVANGQTLTIPSGVTVIVYGQISGTGQIIVDGTLIIIGSVSIIDYPSISGSGTIHITFSSTLSINGNLDIGGVTISGSGTLSVSSGYTVTQTGNITISVPTVNVAGTWANAGYSITIPSGATVTWTTTGRITTSSIAGTLTVNGVLYYYGSGLTAQTSNAVPTFILKLTGTGLFIASPTSTKGNAPNSITLSATAIAPNSADGSISAYGATTYIYLTHVSGSAVGLYGLGFHDSSANTYSIFTLIYIGTASNTYAIVYYANSGQTDKAGDTIYVFNANGSAGTLTLTGTAYV